jgi:hypothetical protein
MSAITMSIKHGRTLAEAKVQLEKAVAQVQRQFGTLIQETIWSEDRARVKLVGRGFEAELWLDAEFVHATGDVPLLTGLCRGPLAAAFRQILQQAFPPRLT